MFTHKSIISCFVFLALFYSVKAQIQCPCSQCFGDQDNHFLKFFEDGNSVNENQILSIAKADNTEIEGLSLPYFFFIIVLCNANI